MDNLIFCGDGGGKWRDAARECGWLVGSQPKSMSLTGLDFTDLDFKNMFADGYLDRYCRFVKRQQPQFAVLPDILTHAHIETCLETGDRVADDVGVLIVVPKVSGIISELPLHIRSTPVVLGVPCSRYGSRTNSVCYWELASWKHGVHLLGGSPIKQLRLRDYLPVTSLDCRQHMNVSVWGDYFKDGRYHRDATYTPKHDRIVELFKESCRNIMEAWR